MYKFHKIHHEYTTSGVHSHIVEFLFSNSFTTVLYFKAASHFTEPIHISTNVIWLIFRLLDAFYGHRGYNFSRTSPSPSCTMTATMAFTILRIAQTRAPCLGFGTLSWGQKKIIGSIRKSLFQRLILKNRKICDYQRILIQILKCFGYLRKMQYARIHTKKLQLYINNNVKMISNNSKMSHNQKLYLREFFNNFFEHRRFNQVVNTFMGGIQVVEGIIAQFEKTANIKCPFSSKKAKSIPNLTQEEAQQQQIEAIDNSFQSIYHRLKLIFKTLEGQTRPTESEDDQIEISKDKTDEELYEVVNDYKKQIAKIKDEKRKLETHLQDQTNHLQNTEEFNLQLKQQNSELKINLERIEATITQCEQEEQRFQSEICVKQMIIKELNQKVEILEAKDKIIEDLELQNRELSTQLQGCKQKNQNLEKQKKYINNLIESKFKEKQNNFKDIINAKLKQSNIIQKPLCQTMNNFIKYTNKQSQKGE